MKKLIICIATLFLISGVKAQEIGPGSYKILKMDVLNFMGLGIQKFHLGYEFSPIVESPKNLTTVQLDLSAPFNSMNFIDINGGVEAGIQLRFYKKWKREQNDAEGIYFGVGLDGGWTSFSEDEEYWLDGNSGVSRTYTHQYDRIRNGIYGTIGSQAKLGQKLYFDVQVGMGWSNVNVKQRPLEIDPNYRPSQDWWWGPSSPFYILFEEGKYQQFYMPVSFSIGYNFGTK